MQKKPQIKTDTKLNPQPEPPSPTGKLDRVGINPQPEPPKPEDALQRVSLNPQPEPPSPTSKLQKVGLNPQPEPPSPASKLDKIGINPQPEPPGSRVMINPQPEPPSGIGKFKAIKIVALLGAIGLGIAGFYFLAAQLLPAVEMLESPMMIADGDALAQAAVNAALIPTLATLIPAGVLLVAGITVKAR